MHRTEPMKPHGWPQVQRWRVAKRAELLAARKAATRLERERAQQIVADLIAAHHGEIADGCIGFYWPIRGELDMRRFVQAWIDDGAEAGLPVALQRDQPLEFWAWRPRAKLDRGIWDIPIPAERSVVQPNTLLVPLLGFDGAGYRLGNGGGYYDRTLAALSPRPVTIGVGLESGRLPTIHPQPHDIRLDAIVTEAGFTWHRPEGTADGADHEEDDAEETGSFASPPCFAHELGDAYQGFLSRDEVGGLLNVLLEGERAGARAATLLAKKAADRPTAELLSAIRGDEARCCAMLSRELRRIGRTPSAAVGAFLDKIIALDGLDQQIALLVKGQAWVVRELDSSLPRIADGQLRAALQDMRDLHETNVDICRQAVS